MLQAYSFCFFFHFQGSVTLCIPDAVEVVGTSTQLAPSDGDIFDWTYDFDTWKTFSAL